MDVKHVEQLEWLKKATRKQKLQFTCPKCKQEKLKFVFDFVAGTGGHACAWGGIYCCNCGYVIAYEEGWN